MKVIFQELARLSSLRGDMRKIKEKSGIRVNPAPLFINISVLAIEAVSFEGIL
jgi:hypothetical protein